MSSETTAGGWDADCLKWRGRVLTGRFAHYCFEWDGLPVDETTPEWNCGCFDQDEMDSSNGR